MEGTPCFISSFIFCDVSLNPLSFPFFAFLWCINFLLAVILALFFQHSTRLGRYIWDSILKSFFMIDKSKPSKVSSSACNGNMVNINMLG